MSYKYMTYPVSPVVFYYVLFYVFHLFNLSILSNSLVNPLPPLLMNAKLKW